MNAKELRVKNPTELKDELQALLRAHFGLRMQQSTQQLTNTSELSKTRRAIARVRTILAEKEKQS
ncbi:MAG: 50S ribosomal protein L29 [Proteobacteria bacterium]|nr:MAG: 50S ribosomal protein L29 [Pseudomonadota bacterium]